MDRTLQEHWRRVSSGPSSLRSIFDFARAVLAARGARPEGHQGFERARSFYAAALAKMLCTKQVLASIDCVASMVARCLARTLLGLASEWPMLPSHHAEPCRHTPGYVGKLLLAPGSPVDYAAMAALTTAALRDLNVLPTLARDEQGRPSAVPVCAARAQLAAWCSDLPGLSYTALGQFAQSPTLVQFCDDQVRTTAAAIQARYGELCRQAAARKHPSAASSLDLRGTAGHDATAKDAAPRQKTKSKSIGLYDEDENDDKEEEPRAKRQRRTKHRTAASESDAAQQAGNKEPESPKHPLSAYMYFCINARPGLKQVRFTSLCPWTLEILLCSGQSASLVCRPWQAAGPKVELTVGRRAQAIRGVVSLGQGAVQAGAGGTDQRGWPRVGAACGTGR